eukprot:TRINITY_DN25072_c0_g1_i2.p1 TRINITY_DN25072_c0_g1~~TRINITY_DN25072_c0_g1_i2.p1  ORF type:complete len:218 (-),score=30.35 TRINITY_DN25072_c0_g1_i2:54-707(-)
MQEFDEKKYEVINRIVTEKGSDAIPSLIALMNENEEDNELLELVQETILNIGIEAFPYLREYLTDEKKKFETNPREYKEISFRTVILIIIDLIGELGTKRDIRLIESFLALYDEEKAHLVIYEAIAKLGGGEKYLDLLELLSFEDDFTEEMIGQLIMTFSFIDNPRALYDLLKINQFTWLGTHEKIMIENALNRLIGSNKKYYELLEKDPYLSLIHI